MNKDRRLGRGLAALLGTGAETDADTIPGPLHETDPAFTADPLGQSPSDQPPESGGEVIVQLNVYEIDDNPFQPRRDFNESEIDSLAGSLQRHEMLAPVLVRKVGDRYQLISGERRLRAATKAGWSTVPARVRDADDRLVAELAIVENVQRKDLNPIEKATSFKHYLDQHQCTQEELAQRLKIDRSTIANLMRLLELPDEVVDHVRIGKLTAGHARALLPLGDEPLQIQCAKTAIQDGWSVRETERQVQQRIEAEDGQQLRVVGLDPEPPAKPARTKSQQIASLEQELRTALGTRVDIRSGSKGRGRMVIHFASHAEFERLRDLLTDLSNNVEPIANPMPHG